MGIGSTWMFILFFPQITEVLLILHFSSPLPSPHLHTTASGPSSFPWNHCSRHSLLAHLPLSPSSSFSIPSQRTSENFPSLHQSVVLDHQPQQPPGTGLKKKKKSKFAGHAADLPIQQLWAGPSNLCFNKLSKCL